MNDTALRCSEAVGHGGRTNAQVHVRGRLEGLTRDVSITTTRLIYLCCWKNETPDVDSSIGGLRYLELGCMSYNVLLGNLTKITAERYFTG